MKNIAILMSFCVMAAPLSACKKTLQKHKVTIEDDKGGHPASHCPPGHAKKGWC
ncbi:MAG: hypothetical protein ACLFR0_04165 [Alphaproteobacteria bacterium]